MLLDSLLSLICPHFCQGCRRLGDALCESCKNDITDDAYPFCLVCGDIIDYNNICLKCQKSSGIARAFVVGENRTILKDLVYNYKFVPARGYGKILAEILDLILPILPVKTVIVPIPTIDKHIRERGFGHTEIIAKILSRKRHLKYSRILLRKDNSVQHGLKARDRAKAASRTFCLNPRAKIPGEVLLIDDIYTTGETVKAAAKMLKSAGARTINLAVIARQSKT